MKRQGINIEGDDENAVTASGHTPLARLCSLLPQDTPGQFLKQCLEHVAAENRRLDFYGTLPFLIYVLAMAFTSVLELGLLALISGTLGAMTAAPDELLTVLRPLAFAVVFLQVLTTELRNASFLIQAADVMVDCGVGQVPCDGSAHDLTLRRFVPVLIAACLASVQYGVGLAVVWLSYLVIGASSDSISTINNALVITFVLQVNKYVALLLRSQVVHRKVLEITKPEKLHRTATRAILFYAVVLLFMPGLIGTAFIAVLLIALSLPLGVILATRSRSRPLRVIVDGSIFYGLIPTLVFGISAFHLPGVASYAPAAVLVAVMILVIHGLLIMLPLLRHGTPPRLCCSS